MTFNCCESTKQSNLPVDRGHLTEPKSTNLENYFEAKVTKERGQFISNAIKSNYMIITKYFSIGREVKMNIYIDLITLERFTIKV